METWYLDHEISTITRRSAREETREEGENERVRHRGEKDGLLGCTCRWRQKRDFLFRAEQPRGLLLLFQSGEGPKGLPEPLPRRVPPFFSSFKAQPSQSTGYTSQYRERENTTHLSPFARPIIYMLMKNPRKDATFEVTTFAIAKSIRPVRWCNREPRYSDK